MFQMTCPACGSRLNANETLVGQTRPCPKCKAPIEIRPPEEAEGALEIDFTPAPAEVDPEFSAEPIAIRPIEKPERLDPNHKYLVLASDRILAKWEGLADGWQVNMGTGFASARRNSDRLPHEGDYVLVELTTRTVQATGHRLKGLRIFALEKRWACGALARDDWAILEKITTHGSLSRDQKLLVRRYLRERFMPEFTEGAFEVLEFLANNDFHTHTIPGRESTGS